MSKQKRRRAQTENKPRSAVIPGTPGREYAALDGWRGLCACLVALYHFRAVLGHPVNSHFVLGPIVPHAYLFVDFFFVLSGFVISARYEARISNGLIGVVDFLKLRLGRLYPLHIFSLLVMVALFTYFRNANDLPIHVRTPGIDSGFESFFINIFMVQGLHTMAGLTWNHPSWSISTEFATYAVYALLWKSLKDLTWVANAMIIVGAPIMIALLVGHMDTTWDWGILRSLLGFALGSVVYGVMRHAAMQAFTERSGFRTGTAAELAVILVTGFFVAQPDRTKLTIAAPFVFAAAVLVFSSARGAVSTLFSSRVVRYIGTISYSIYMLHWPVEAIFMRVATWVWYYGGWSWLFVRDPVTQGISLGNSYFMGDIYVTLMLALLIGISALSYRFIEKPWRERVRRRVAAA